MTVKAQEQLMIENEELRAQLEEAEETLRAIRSGEVDALIVSGAGGDQIFTLTNADYFYRVLFEDMSEGALILAEDGVILYANRYFSEMLKTPLEQVIGSTIHTWVEPVGQKILQALLQQDESQSGHGGEVALLASDGSSVPGLLSVKVLKAKEMAGYFAVVVTDLTEQKRNEAISISEKLTMEALKETKRASLALLSVIEDQKQTEEKLRESEELFRQVYEHMEVGVARVSLDSRIQSANEAYCRMLGYSEAELVGKHLVDITHPESIEENLRQQSQLATGEINHYQMEKRFIHKDGRAVYGILDANLIRDAQGKPHHLLSSVLDISERKRTENALKQSTQRFEALLSQAPFTGVIYRFIYDDAKNIVDWEISDINELGASSIGLTVETAIGKSAIALFGKETMLPYLETARQVAVSGKPQTLETYFKSNDRYYLSSVFMVDSDHYANMSIDITERKQAEEALLQRENLLNKIFDVLPVGIWLADKNGQLTRSNQTGREIWGAEPLVGQEQYGVFKARRLPSEEELAPEDWALAHTIKEGVTVLDEVLEIDSFDGKKKIILNFTAPVFDAAGNVEAAVIINLDITERKQTEEKIKENASLLRIAGEKAKLGGWSVDLRNNVCTWSDQTAVIHERPAGYLPLVEEGISYYAPEWHEKITKVFTECAQNGIPYDEEMEIITANGKRVWVRTIGEPVKDEAGKIIKVQGAFQDITERKRAEEALRESEERFKVLHNASFGGIAIHDKGKIMECNQGLSEMMGYSRDELLLMDGYLLIAPDSRELVKNNVAANFEKPYEAFGMRKNGEIFPIQLEARSVPYKGKTVRTVEFRDITERKQMEEALRESETFIKTVLNNLPVGVAVNSVEPTVAFNYMNDNFAKFYRTTKEKLADPNTFWDAAYEEPDFRETMRKRILDDLASGDPERMSWVDIPVARKGEATTFITARNIPIPNQPLMISTVWDVTERKQAEDKLAASEVRYRRLFEATRDGILILDAETGMVVDVNPFLIELLGYSHEVFLGKKLWEMGFFKDIAASKEKFLELQHQEYIRYEDLPLETADGRRINVEFTSNVYHTDHQKVIQCNIRDLTERKQAQEQLHKTLEELKRSNIELEQFAYIASHDLQEPLRAVAGMVQLLQKRYEGQLDTRADEYINLAMDGATRMQTLITDLLTYSRVERRGNPMQPVDANKSLTSALRNLQVSIAEQGATVTSETLPTLEADASQLTQLFQNLIGNAIKFHGEHPTLVHVGVEKLENAWHFSVCDNGIGIDPQYFERIFLVFQRLHTRREYSGTGIGLSICKKIVERHGGRIWIESQPGQGTTFHFTIPFRS